MRGTCAQADTKSKLKQRSDDVASLKNVLLHRLGDSLFK